MQEIEKMDDANNQGIMNSIMKIVSKVPTSECVPTSNSEAEAQRLIFIAKSKAAAIAGGLALPPGPLGMLTILPDLILIWNIQSQLVADIAALYGKTAFLKKEAMVYCLFRHGVSSLTRDLVVRVGERVLVRRVSLRFMQKILNQIGIEVTQKVLSRGVSRWVPGIGACVISAYAWYDTNKVGETAIAYFKMGRETVDCRL